MGRFIFWSGRFATEKREQLPYDLLAFFSRIILYNFLLLFLGLFNYDRMLGRGQMASLQTHVAVSGRRPRAIV